MVWADLQQAERWHIEKLRSSGRTVINHTGGGNGRPPAFRVVLSGPAAAIEPVPYNPVAPMERRGHLDLVVTWRRPDRDWDITLRQDNVLCAVPGSHGERHRPGKSLSLDRLSKMYELRHGRSLPEDLASRERTVPAEEDVPVLYWSAAPRRLANGRVLLDSADLSELTRDEVERREIGRPLASAGYRVDPRVQRHGGLNSVVRIETEGSTGVYAKTEENEAAKRAEVVASALLVGLRWVGISDRVTQNVDATLLLVPELGAGDIEDRGTISELFATFGREDPSTLACDNAHYLWRLTQENLRLRVPREALLLLLFDAAICNTDRNAGNLKYGSDRGAPMGTPRGRLLPVDHGRCLLNTDPSAPGRSNISPIAALRGDSPYGLPNQLIRPAAQLINDNFAAAVDTGTAWLSRIRDLAAEMTYDWEDYARDEIAVIATNSEILLADLPGVFDQVCSWVIA